MAIELAMGVFLCLKQKEKYKMKISVQPNRIKEWVHTYPVLGENRFGTIFIKKNINGNWFNLETGDIYKTEDIMPLPVGTQVVLEQEGELK